MLGDQVGHAVRYQVGDRRSLGDPAATHFIDATRLASQLLGDAIVANLFLLGYAWQWGLIPVSRAAIKKSLELNGAAVEMSRNAFRFGRLAAHNAAANNHYTRLIFHEFDLPDWNVPSCIAAAG